jgi:probable blue pigment (indigoidine) exporter
VIIMNRANAALLLATLSWGLSLTVADAALEDLSAADLLLVETLTGTLTVALVCVLRRRPLGGAWRPAFALGSLEPGVAYVFANVGLMLTSAAVGSMLFALESVFVVVLAWALLRTRPVRVEAVALLLGVLGTVLVASAERGGSSSGLGVTFMILSTLASAGYVFATRRFAAGQEPLALVARQGAASLVVTSPFIVGSWLVEGSDLGSASGSALLLAALSGLLGFAIPFTLWTVAMPRVRPGFAAVSLNLTPLVGVVSATLLGQGALALGQWAGGALILGGVVMLTRAELRASPTSDDTGTPPPPGPTSAASAPASDASGQPAFPGPRAADDDSGAITARR